MLLLCWSMLLLCLCVSAENLAMCRESGENVTLECSSAGCLDSSFLGMYLYHDFAELEEVLYYYSGPEYEKISPRRRYKNRIQKEGSLKNHTITISNLTVDDSGLYRCMYQKTVDRKFKCKVYTLVVTSSSEVSSESPSTTETWQPLVLVTVATFAVSVLITTIFLKIIVPRVKYWTSSSRRARIAEPVNNDYVYEIMTLNGLRLSAAS